MLNRTKFMSFVASLVMLLVLAPSVMAQFTPAIAADSQNVIDGTVVVKMAIANGPSWVVIHADDKGKPGVVLGQTAIPEGVSKDVTVAISGEGLTNVLHAMLHDDTGTVGEFEFPTADNPTRVGNAIVMVHFDVTGEATSLIGAAKAAGNFNTLLAAAEAAGLTETLMQEGPLTVFAPSDEAFAKIPQETLDALLADTDALTKVLTYHVVPGAVKSSEIADGTSLPTIEGEDVAFSVADGTVKVNDATVTSADIEASNGIIHVIDTVLMPPSMGAETAEVAASEAVTATEAMSDTAEVAATEAVTATEAMSDTAAVAATEAVTATEAMSETAEVAASDTTTTTEAAAGMDIVDTAVAGEFNTLVTALQAAGLVDALKGEGPFTVFAPTDDAFAKIPQATLDALLADPKGDLTQILLSHVIPGRVLSTDITDGMEVETLQGGKLKFTVNGDEVMVNGAKIVAVDIPASNGVIHVIDTVITPEAEEAAAPAAEAAPAAPEQMPATGGSTNTMVTLLIVGLVLAGLAGSTILNRRRTA